MKPTFWISNGTNCKDDPVVIVSHDEKIKCNHCYNRRFGFVELGADNPTSLQTYAICKPCLYNPATNMVNNLFIAVGRNNSPDRFAVMLDDCTNKEKYLDVLRINCMESDRKIKEIKENSASLIDRTMSYLRFGFDEFDIEYIPYFDEYYRSVIAENEMVMFNPKSIAVGLFYTHIVKLGYGISQRDIAELFNIAKSTVSHSYKKIKTVHGSEYNCLIAMIRHSG